MGISLTDYEEQFFDLMNSYLPEADTVVRIKHTSLVWFKRVSLAWLVLIAGSLIVLAWDLARRRDASWGIGLACVLVTVLEMSVYLRTNEQSAPENSDTLPRSLPWFVLSRYAPAIKSGRPSFVRSPIPAIE